MNYYRKYLSFGGGVNSVALYLFLIDHNVDFEAVFVNHGTDWPETYEYFNMFQGWLLTRGLPRITVLTPLVQGSTTLYEHCKKYKMVPSWRNRWCTDKFKIQVTHKYYKKPATEMLGIDFGEIKRARISSRDGFECRYPLVEWEIDRAGCEDIIRSHNLPIPQKSGCYICPYQKLGEWKRLRREQPDLFCNAEQLENESNKSRIERGKPKIYIGINHKGSLRSVIDENQMQLWKEDEYPPCNCGL